VIGTSISLFFALLVASIPVAAVLGLLGLSLAQLYSFIPIHRAIGEVAWAAGTDFILFAVPLYILMGELLLRSGVADRMYESMRHWLSWLPGGLMHSNIGACALFAATSGSSVATAATIGTVALPQQRRHGYNERLFLGTIAAGGTLGILIPPSINTILYGYLAEVSVPKLYLASFIPGFLLAGLFMLTTLIACLLRPAWGGRHARSTWHDRLASLPHLGPPLVIFLIVIGSIYSGLATPTESAALGVVASLGLAAWYRKLSWRVLREAFEGTLRTTAMVQLIVLGAFFLNFVLSSIGLTRATVAYIQGLGLEPYWMIFAIVVFYVILGCFMDAMAMMITTVPIVVPIVHALGFDLVWFGVLMIVLCETGMVTPPFGINLFVVQSVRRRGSLDDVIVGVAPFILTLFVMLALLVAFPQIALWLPQAVQ
jgi:tripartite ATP-independent transporter DctM subunit